MILLRGGGEWAHFSTARGGGGEMVHCAAHKSLLQK